MPLADYVNMCQHVSTFPLFTGRLTCNLASSFDAPGGGAPAGQGGKSISNSAACCIPFISCHVESASIPFQKE